MYLQHDPTECVVAVTCERIDRSPSNGAVTYERIDRLPSNGGMGFPFPDGLALGCPVAKMDQIIAGRKLIRDT